MPRPPRPDDLYRLRVAAEPRLSPDGRLAVVTLQTVAPGFDGYRHALWLVATDGSAAPRQLTLGARHDHHPRFSPDGRTLAFISDRRAVVEEEPTWPKRDPKDREDIEQVQLLPLDGGEARRLTNLPRGVDAFEWSPDGTRLVVVTTSYAATQAADDRRRGIDRTRLPGVPPPSDYRFIDRLDYMLNGTGFTYDHVGHLWLVDVATGVASRLTAGRVADREPAWSPDGRRIAFSSNRRRDADLLSSRMDIHVVDVETREVTAVTRGPRSMFFAPAWLPDGRTIAALGQSDDRWRREPQRHLALRRRRQRRDPDRRPQPLRGVRPDARLGDGQRHHARREPDSDPVARRSMAPFQRADRRLLRAVADPRRRRPARAPDRGSAVRLGLACRRGRVGHGRGTRIAYLRSTPTEPPDLWLLVAGGSASPSRTA